MLTCLGVRTRTFSVATVKAEMDEDHYDTPWEFLARPGSIRLSTAEIRLPTDLRRSSPSHSPNLPPSPSFSNHLVHIGNSPQNEQKRISLRVEKNRIKIDFRKEEEALVERGVDRIEAEKRLESRNLGDFLLRFRNEGSAALSLRGTTGILHIKLEKRGDKWIVGEGPCFRSISSAIHYYRKNPLPIRGSEHMILKKSITQMATV